MQYQIVSLPKGYVELEEHSASCVASVAKRRNEMLQQSWSDRILADRKGRNIANPQGQGQAVLFKIL
jgi:hypothetical protein